MRIRRFTAHALTALAATAALTLFAPSGQAQETDGRWLAFVGCWEAVGAEDEIGLLCFEPADGGVELTNYVDGELASTERMAADGQQRPIRAEGCEGWESVVFSSDGHRAFTRTEFTCAEGSSRSGTGVMALVGPEVWVDVRELDVDGETVAWVQEYVLADSDRLQEEAVEDPAAELGLAVRSARMAAASPIDLDAVEEATGRMGARAVETWIVTERDEIDVDEAELVRLDDAGVPERVIDAVVAVSHPDRFMVEAGGRIDEAQRAPKPTHYRGYMGYNPWFTTGWSAGFGYGRFGYSPFRGYYSPFGYSPGYYGYGYGYGYWGSRPGIVIIDRRPSDNGGRYYRGRGYSSGDRAITGRSARPRSGSARPSYSTGGSRSAAPSRGGTSRRAKPRKAKRRGGGAGGDGGWW